MTTDSRRRFLRGSAVALTSVAAGSVSACSPAPLLGQNQPGAKSSVAGFGWEVENLNGNGADVYFLIQNAMLLNSVDIDVAFMPLALGGSGFAEVLCVAGVSRGALPTFDNTGGHAYMSLQSSPSFGSVNVYNPNNLQIVYDGTLAQDQFHQVILKAWVPAEGTASATARNVLINPSLSLNAGDYLVFHMDHAGVPVDAEMQVTLLYSIA